MMATLEALRAVSDFAALQGKVVREFLRVYAPRDRERFFDVPNGTMSVDGAPWHHRRHGAGVTFTGPGDVVVNAHVEMVDYPEAIDGGRIFEYLESAGVGSVTLGADAYAVTPESMWQLVRDMVTAGLLRAVTTQGRYQRHICCLPSTVSGPDDVDAGHRSSS
jgi:hypothetical protein